ncbi:MAG: serine O-acetyltransferase [Deltaproteobacteria bacterium RBG_13_53_10]|nr:MAG: serine O-acetyltransferase [Deltaproteobacteria bacterium RBG_13_53_10]
MWEHLKEDIRTIKERDPAARNYLEILLCYPGLHAVQLHRIAHFLYGEGWYTTARLISHFSRWFTGIEIHPGAKIGKRLFIDHGMGVVIGETTEIGDDCLIYKGVVLGGTSLVKKKRHPTLGNRVIIGSNSTVLGAIHIGDGVRIGSGSVVVKSVPAGATVVGVPGRIMESATPEKEELDFEHGNIPDPLSDIMKILLQLHQRLEERVKRLENQSEPNRSDRGVTDG